MNYASLNLFDTQNGPGVRVSLFVSGCTLACPGCFNREAQNFKYGKLFDGQTEQRILDALDNPDVAGLSLLGGDPCEQKNIVTIAYLCKVVKASHPDKTIWLWTGRTIDQVRQSPYGEWLLENVDVVVDGPFVQEKHDPKLEYRGSSNQKVYFKQRDGSFVAKL